MYFTSPHWINTYEKDKVNSKWQFDGEFKFPQRPAHSLVPPWLALYPQLHLNTYLKKKNIYLSPWAD